MFVSFASYSKEKIIDQLFYLYLVNSVNKFRQLLRLHRDRLAVNRVSILRETLHRETTIQSHEQTSILTLALNIHISMYRHSIDLAR